MFLLKSLGTLVWGSEKSELVKIEGELHRVSQGVDRCVFLHSATTIQRSPENPHASSLVVSRIVNEDVVDSEDPSEAEELTFLLAPELNFYVEDEVIHWDDPDTKGDTWRLVVDSSDYNLLQLFQLTALQAVHEWLHKASPENATDEELLALQGKRRTTAAAAAPTARTTQVTPQKPQATGGPHTPEAHKPASPSSRVFRTSSLSNLPERKPLLRSRPDLALTSVSVFGTKVFWYNVNEGMYDLLAEKATVEILRQGSLLKYYLYVHDGDKDLDFQTISSDLNPVFYHDKPLTFTYGTQDGDVSQSWGLKIDADSERGFVDSIVKSLTETQREEAFTKLKEDEQSFLRSGYMDVDEELDESQIDSSDEELENEGEEEEEEEQDERGTSRSSGRGEKNSQLVVGYNYDRSFVVRGNQIGVFKHTDDSLEFSTTIKDLKTPGEHAFSPSKIMLHSQDSSMILMNPHNRHALYKLDLNYGKVVEEWDVDENMDVSEICPESKYAQKTANQKLVGMSHNAIFLIDPRISSKFKRVTDMTKQYARESRNEFSSTATTDEGELVVVSKKGDLRLFSDINKNAKTHLPGFGDPIIGVDVTADGKWILATCKTYLIVIATEIPGTEKTGFQKPMGQKKPIPKRLQLKSEHIVAMGSQPSFTPARFNVGEDEETTIITSSGQYVVSWNFRRIKAGHLYDYRIKKYSDTVVADNFRYGQHKSIVVALPDDVTMTQKANLIKPKDATF